MVIFSKVLFYGSWQIDCWELKKNEDSFVQVIRVDIEEWNNRYC